MQPSGAATPRNSDAHERIAVPKAFCVLRERLRPRPKSGKVRRSDTRPGDIRERAARIEGSDSGPIRNNPCFAVCALVCDLSLKAECVPAFACESKRGPFVREVEKRFELEVVTVTFGRYLRERFWTKSRTLQEGFSSVEGRSILVQDKGPQSQAPAARPQSPAVRGFPRF